MSKQQGRTWSLVISLGVPLITVGVLAMAISYVTLIDVAKVNKIPLPLFFPIIIDVGMIGVMITAAQLRIRGLSGSWLAYLLFTGLSVYSVAANATHALGLADMTKTTVWAAAITAAIPPTVLLGFTHLVMKLVPSVKEREKLQAAKERSAQKAARLVAMTVQPEAVQQITVAPETASVPAMQTPSLTLVAESATSAPDDEEVIDKVLQHIEETGARPTGKTVGEWLGGKTPKTGQRFLAKLVENGTLDTPELQTKLGS